MGIIKRKSVKKNFAYQFVYQALLLIIPLIISPYLTRTVGDSALGNFSYANSIAYYFVLFANLGISRHGQRIISSSKNEIEIRKGFWSLYCLHAIFSFISIFIYLFFVTLFVKDKQWLFYIETLYVASALFDITWLFTGLENFKYVVIRSTVVKVVELALIFLLVKDSSSLGIYAFITGGSLLVGQMCIVPTAVLHYRPIKFTKKDLIVHLKPFFIFSISIIAVSLYTVFDKTLLGLLSTKENVAYYEYANKIISIPRTFISIVGSVMFPRACKLASEGNSEGQKRYLSISLLSVGFMGFSSAFGIMALGKEIALVYYGDSFSTSGDIMVAMSFLPFICGLGEIIRSQYLIPNGRDKEYTFSILISAALNLVLSSLLIPIIGVMGAVAGTSIAELFGCVYQMIICRKSVSVFSIFKNVFPFALIGLFMEGALRIPIFSFGNDLLTLIAKFIFGAVVFLLVSAIYIFLFRRDIWLLLAKPFSKKRYVTH